jgi:hypothetical protein
LSRIRYCMAWWDSIDPRERSLLYMLLLFYIDSLFGLLVLFIGTPIIILILVFNFYGLSWSPIAVLLVLIVSMELFRRALLQCNRLDCFLVGKPLYYIIILNDVLMGLVNALIIAIIAYLILAFMFGFEIHALILMSLMLAISTFALVVVVYFRRPRYMMLLLLPLATIVYVRTGVTNLFPIPMVS